MVTQNTLYIRDDGHCIEHCHWLFVHTHQNQPSVKARDYDATVVTLTTDASPVEPRTILRAQHELAPRGSDKPARVRVTHKFHEAARLGRRQRHILVVCGGGAREQGASEFADARAHKDDGRAQLEVVFVGEERFEARLYQSGVRGGRALAFGRGGGARRGERRVGGGSVHESRHRRGRPWGRRDMRQKVWV